jgi:hypothetical protein
MRRLSTAFIGGLIVGAVAVVGAGYWAGFERPPLTQFLLVQQTDQGGREQLAAVERRIPVELHQCVAREAAESQQRQHAILTRALARELDLAVSRCVAQQTTPKAVAQK